jgi:hypothetical protein
MINLSVSTNIYLPSDDVSSSDCIALNGRMAGEQWIGKGVGGHDCGLI